MGLSLEGVSTSILTHSSGTAATSTQTYIQDPSLGASLGSGESDDDDSGGGGLPVGVKVTISITTLAGVLLIAFAVLCILRYRSKATHGRRPNFRRLIQRRGPPPKPESPTESPTPLVSPTVSRAGTDGTRMTPPPPLKDRKMLDVGASSRPSSATSQSRSGSRAGFPASPVFAPTLSTLVPRSERTARAHGAGISPPIFPLGWMATGRNEGSLRSISSKPTTSTSIISATATTSSEQAGSSSTPVRSHQSRAAATQKHEIPSPGPPPRRAIPSTPPPRHSGQTSQPTTAASSIRHGDIGAAIGMVTHNPACDAVLAQESQDLCEMTEPHGLESRDSWDTWRSGGGGGPGASMSPPPRRELHSPVMQEEDLERLGGRY